MLIAIIIIEPLAAALWIVAIYIFARPMVRGAIYFPTSSRNVEIIMKFAGLAAGTAGVPGKNSDGIKIADLGSGDGKILIAAAEYGAIATGYEINPLLVIASRNAIKKAGAKKGIKLHASVMWKSFWKADLSKFDVVIVYGIPYIMDGLRQKLERELQPGAIVISNIYSFHGWTPTAKKGEVYKYVWRGTK